MAGSKLSWFMGKCVPALVKLNKEKLVILLASKLMVSSNFTSI